MLHTSCKNEPVACEDHAQLESSCPPAALDLTEPRDHHRCSAPYSFPIDLMIPPALAPETCPSNIHAYMSRQGESPFSRQQPKIAAGDHYPLQRGAAAISWPIRCYSCSFCGREFNSAQALGGHMNIHRRDRARLRTISHHSSTSPQHDLPPTASADQIAAQTLQAPLHRYNSSTSQLYLPFREASFGDYCEVPTSSSISQNTYSPSPMMHASGAGPPAFKRGATMTSTAASPIDYQHPFDYSSFSAQISNPIPILRFGSSSTRSSAATSSNFSKLQTDHNSPLLQKSSPLIRSPRPKSTPVAALNCRSAQDARASKFRLGLAGGSTTRASADQYGAHAAQHLIEFKETEVHNKRRSLADAVAASSEDRPIGSIQRPSQYYNDRPSSAFVARDSDSVHGVGAAVPATSAINDSTTPANNDSLACLDLELRLGRRSSSLSAGNRTQPSALRRPP
eukprot:c10629_g1_i2 orf=304-1662(-)